MASDTVTFREAATLVRQGVQPEDVGDMPYIGLEHIEEGKLRLLGIGSAKDVTSTKSRFSKGDILFGKLRPYFRKVIRVTFDGVCSTDIWVVRSKPGIDQGYLYYWMASQTFVNFATQGSEGTKMPRAKWDHVGRFQQTRLPETDQRAIAHILGSLDDKIELNQRMNQTLEAMARAIFKSWFVDFDPVRAKATGRDPGLPAEIAALFPDSFEDSDLWEIPKGWDIATLEDLFPKDKNCVLTGPFGSKLHSYDYRDEGVPLLLVKHIIDGKIAEDNIPLVGFHKTPELDRYRLDIGDIVFTRVGAVGRSAYIHPRYEKWLFSGQTLRVRVPCREVLNPRYLSQIYLEPSFITMVESHALGSTRPSLNTGLLSNFRFLLAPIHLQDIWSKYISSLDDKIQKNRSQNCTLSSLRDTLLPKLISGELRLPAAALELAAQAGVPDAEKFVKEAGV